MRKIMGAAMTAGDVMFALGVLDAVRGGHLHVGGAQWAVFAGVLVVNIVVFRYAFGAGAPSRPAQRQGGYPFGQGR